MARKVSTSAPRARSVTPEEAEVWRDATRTLEPLRGKPRTGTARAEAPASGAARASAPPVGQRASARTGELAGELAGERVGPATPTPPRCLPGFDRRRARAIAAGRRAIGARLDLHGADQRAARTLLAAFLHEAQASGHTTVLVITGKGTGSEPPDRLARLLGMSARGVLREMVPLWLAEPDLRDLVVSFTAAGARHGGTGALYVQLRKK